MEQSSTNENMISGTNETIEICMHDVVLGDRYGKTQVSKQKQVVIYKMIVKK
jgi:hypothetical protein